MNLHGNSELIFNVPGSQMKAATHTQELLQSLETRVEHGALKQARRSSVPCLRASGQPHTTSNTSH